MCEAHAAHHHAQGAHQHDAHGGSGKIAGASFEVADMTCDHCVGTIRTALNRVLPDAAIEINLPSHRVTVAGDVATAAAAIRGAGYTPHLIG